MGTKLVFRLYKFDITDYFPKLFLLYFTKEVFLKFYSVRNKQKMG